MIIESTGRQPLLLLDGAGGPSPERFVPRLGRRHELHLVTERTRAELAAAARLSPAELDRYAHVHHVADRRELAERAAGLADEHRFVGVLAFSELLVETSHALAAAHGLPATSASSLGCLRNKVQQRRALQAAGLPVPAFAAVRTLAELREALQVVQLPAVLKPEAGAGGMATFAVRDGSDVAAIWAQAQHIVATDPRAQRDVGFVVESELIGTAAHDDARFGDYVSVESLVGAGVVEHIGVCDKFPLSPPFRENGEIFPSSLPDAVQAALLDQATRVIAALGLDNTATHLEFKLTASGPVLIEANARIGGGIAEIVELATGLDLVALVADVATGAFAPGSPLPPARRFGAYFCPQPPLDAARLGRVASVAELLGLDGMVDASVAYRVGDRPDPTRGTRSALLQGYASTATVEQLHDLNARLTSDEFFAYAGAD